MTRHLVIRFMGSRSMELLETIEVRGGRRVELRQGDLTDMARHEWIDALVVSALAGDYTPTRTALIGALHRRGISVKELATRKEIDLTHQFATWLSPRIETDDPRIGFGRVLCFQPDLLGRPPEAVGHLFRALVPIVAERDDIRTIAMPVLSSGDAGYSLDQMLPPLLDAAVNSLRHGLPLERIAIVVRSDRDVSRARSIFAKARDESGEYDVFVSYSQRDTAATDMFVTALQAARPDTRVFVDRVEIDKGAAWQRRVFESLERCRKVVAMLTPEYLASDICLEEYNIAWMRSREEKETILTPLFVREASLPAYMRSRQYADCREADAKKLTGVATAVADSLR
jgi:hypothetical protein